MRHSVWIIAILLSGCGQLGWLQRDVPPASPPVAEGATLRTPPPEARLPEQFDTTSAAERADAVRAPESGDVSLGTTIVSLGDPARPGFWLATPLVDNAQPGRVVLAERSVAVTLEPIDGPATGGSRLSLPAMRLLGVPLTALSEVDVRAENAVP